MPYKPKIFVGCTTESNRNGLSAALIANMRAWAHAEVWHLGNVFSASSTTIEDLESGLALYDAAVFLFEGNDKIISRGVESSGVRDNLLFEFGLAMGLLGRTRTFFIMPEGEDIKIPSDLKGMFAGTYDPSHTNKKAALFHCSETIKTAYEKNSSEQNRNKSYNKKPVIELDYLRHHHQVGKSHQLEEHLKKIFSEGLIRENWNIILHYDISRVNEENIITEEIIWDYVLTNITTEKIEKDITLDLYGDERNSIIQYYIEDKNRKKTVLISHHNSKKQQGFVRESRSFTFEPGEQYLVSMCFKQDFSVDNKTCRIHNCFASKQFTLGATIKSHIPNGFTMYVLDVEPNEPITFGGTYDFKFRDPLLPEQVIEYIFERNIK